jgi:O-antigen/teichoic acid export membrane protein
MFKEFSFLQNLKSSLFVKNFVILLTGSSISQIIPLIAIIFLVKIYSPDELGIYFLFSSIVMVTSIIATLQYELAIIIPEKDYEGSLLFLLSLFISSIVALLLFVVIVFAHDVILEMFKLRNNGEGVKWLLYIPVAVFFNGVIQSLNSYFNRNGMYKEISIGRSAKSAGISIPQLVFGSLKLTRHGLFLGHIIGQWIGVIYLLWRYRKHFSLHTIKNKTTKLWLIARRFKKFPMFNALISSINAISVHIPVFLFMRFFGPVIAAQYGIAHRTIFSPMGLVSHSLSQLFIKEASDRYNQNQDIMSLVKKIQHSIFKTSLVPFILTFFFAPFLFSFILGEEWRNSGYMVSIMCPWLFFIFFNGPFNSIYSIVGRQNRLLIYNILLLIARVAAIYIGYLFFDDFFISLVIYSMVGLAFNIFLYFDRNKMIAIASRPRNDVKRNFIHSLDDKTDHV